MNKYEKLGMLHTSVAYTLWGLIPIYWNLVSHVPPGEVLAHRIIWSAVFLFFLILLSKMWKPFIEETKIILKSRKKGLQLTLASILISLNWLLFIWAVNSAHVVQASLGYYINPLVSILLGILVLREKSTRGQNIAFILAGIGVLYLTFSLGVFPWVSLALALSFGLYGLLKKLLHLHSVLSVWIESVIVTPIALIYILFLPEQHFQVMDFFSSTNALLMGAGIASAVPLLLFSSGAKHIPLAMVGILQCIAPTLMLIIGVFMFNESFTMAHFIAFLFIWTALLIYMGSHFKRPIKEVEEKGMKQVN